MKVSELLAQAFGLLKVMPTKGTYAVNASGESVNPWDDSACAVCSLGALYRVSGAKFEDDSPAGQLFTRARLRLNQECSEQRLKVYSAGYGFEAAIHDVNDRLPTEVLHGVWESTIAKARAEEGCAIPQ